jgi:Na+/proline symporter
VSAGRGALPWLADTTFYVALSMAAFTILFGTRHLDATERHEGWWRRSPSSRWSSWWLSWRWGFCHLRLFDGFGDLFSRAAREPQLQALMRMGAGGNGYANWFALTLLSMLAVMFLPRQFQVTVVENVNENHLRRAIWLFPLYLLLINVFVLPIALGGLMRLPGRGGCRHLRASLPMVFGHGWLALLVFIGGLSAATGMVIVETIALSTMVCNDLVMPLLLRYRWLALQGQEDVSGVLLGIRRGAIV